MCAVASHVIGDCALNLIHSAGQALESSQVSSFLQHSPLLEATLSLGYRRETNRSWHSWIWTGMVYGGD